MRATSGRSAERVDAYWRAFASRAPIPHVMLSLRLVVPPLLALAACVAPAADSAQVEVVLAEEYSRLAKEHQVPGLVFGVTIDGTRHVFCTGLADDEQNVPSTAATLFEIGSVSKVFTATLACLAEQRSVLSLADAPSRIAPEFANAPLDHAHLVHLGTYTAGGLPLQFPEDVAPDAAAAWCRAFARASEPGTQRHYSNPSIGLLGHLVATAWKREFATCLTDELLHPLGMTRTFVVVPENEAASYAWGRRRTGERVRVAPGPFADETYGIKTCVDDLLTLLEANLRPDELPADLAAAVRATQLGRFACGGFVQGMGWEKVPYPIARERLLEITAAAVSDEDLPAVALPPAASSPSTWFHKTGSTNGFGAYVVFVPKLRLGLVMLANRNVPIPARVAAVHAVIERLAR